MDAPLSGRDPPTISHGGSGSVNTNLGSGEQTINSQSGSHNRQIFAKEYHEHAPGRETPPLPTHNLPFPRDDAFVERDELNELQSKLKPGKRVVLCGLGGVGKSQLAIEQCYRVRDASTDTWVFWIHTSNAARFDQDIWRLANDAKIPGRDEQENIFQLVRGWLNDGRKRWLIVLDNADEAGFLFESPLGDGAGMNRLDYLPICSHGSILVTTRRHTVATKLVDAGDIITLQPSRSHAEKLLEAKLGAGHDTSDCGELITALECIPLAIAQAAAYIRESNISVKEYLRLYQESDDQKAALLNEASDEVR